MVGHEWLLCEYVKSLREENERLRNLTVEKYRADLDFINDTLRVYCQRVVYKGEYYFISKGNSSLEEFHLMMPYSKLTMSSVVFNPDTKCFFKNRWQLNTKDFVYDYDLDKEMFVVSEML